MDGLFNLKDPDYDNEQWRNSLLAAIGECDRKIVMEMLNANIQQQHLFVSLLLVQLVDGAVGGGAKDVIKAMLTAANKNELSILQLRTGKTEKEIEEQGEKAKTRDVDESVDAWERVFGKRGDAKTESAIQQTTNILMSMITEAEKEKKAQGTKRVF